MSDAGYLSGMHRKLWLRLREVGVTIEMMTITETLIAEHRVFTEVFDQIESFLPKLTTLAEVKLLARLAEGMLQGHADTENNLAYAALDHVLKDKGHLDRLHQDHQEIDENLRRVQTARDFDKARRLLKSAIIASRKHFQREEQSIFPLIERVLRQDTLAELASAHFQQRLASAA
jgi:hemerythrin-like domain-containing protein